MRILTIEPTTQGQTSPIMQDRPDIELDTTNWVKLHSLFFKQSIRSLHQLTSRKLGAHQPSTYHNSERNQDVMENLSMMDLIEQTFISSLEVSFNGIRELAFDEITPIKAPTMSVSCATQVSKHHMMRNLDISNQDIRLLVLLCNVAFIKAQSIPQHMALFAECWKGVSGHDKVKVMSAIDRLDAELFEAYIEHKMLEIQDLVHEGLLMDRESWSTIKKPSG